MSEIPVIQTAALSYQYRKGEPILDNLALSVPPGSIYGFLGPNGSGKTTTLSLLLGLLPVQQGDIRIFGQSLQTGRLSILRQTGALIEAPSLYGHLSAAENLEVYRRIYGAAPERIGEVLGTVELADTGGKVVRRFSLGMKQRLALALALLPRPRLLILDEPTNGLDPNGIIELRNLLKRLNKVSGITILVSSHMLGEVEKMVSHVGIINKGKMLFQGTLQELHREQQKQSRLQLHTSDNEAAYRLLKDYQPERSRESLLLTCPSNLEIARINRLLYDHYLDVYLLQPRETSLEQLFIHLTSSRS